MGGELVPTVPVQEAAALGRVSSRGRGATSDGDPRRRTACRRAGRVEGCPRSRRATGAKLAWVPRRAGDRGAVETGCLPNLLPGGRPVADASARVDLGAVWGGGPAGSPAETARDHQAAARRARRPPRGRRRHRRPSEPRSAREALARRSSSAWRSARARSPAPPTSSSRWLRSPRSPACSSAGRAAPAPSARCWTNPARSDIRVLAGIAEEIGAPGLPDGRPGDGQDDRHRSRDGTRPRLR